MAESSWAPAFVKKKKNVSALSVATLAKLSTCKRDCLALKSCNIFYLALKGKGCWPPRANGQISGISHWPAGD